MPSGRNLRNTLENIVRMDLGKTATHYTVSRNLHVTASGYLAALAGWIDSVATNNVTWTGTYVPVTDPHVLPADRQPN
jgi:hypothetical protein